MSDSLSPEAVSKQLDFCSFCPKMCRHACPVSTTDGHESHTPQGKMNLLNLLNREQLEWDSSVTAPLWACTGCRHCTQYCEHGNEPGLVLFSGRAKAHAHGAGHPRLANYAQRFRRRERRLTELARELANGDSPSTGNVGFWPGCDAIDKGRNDTKAALSLFNALGGPPVHLVATQEVCGGYPLLAAGYPDMFRWHAERVARALGSFETIITNCSACRFTMTKQYAAEGVELVPEVVSASEYLAKYIAAIPKIDNGRRLYYHDPCHLARYSGIIDEPRTVLSKLGDLRDFDWSHTDAECCGGAGLLPKTHPDTADAMARRRLREIAQRGGGTVVTSCATCTYMLKSNAPGSVDVFDLPAFVAKVCTIDVGHEKIP